MDKLSSILPSNRRTKVEVDETHPARPGSPSFGRTEGTTASSRDRVFLSSKAKELLAAHNMEDKVGKENPQSVSLLKELAGKDSPVLPVKEIVTKEATTKEGVAKPPTKDEEAKIVERVSSGFFRAPYIKKLGSEKPLTLHDLLTKDTEEPALPGARVERGIQEAETAEPEFTSPQQPGFAYAAQEQELSGQSLDKYA